MNKQLIFDHLHASYHMASQHQDVARLSLGDKALDKSCGGGLLTRRVHLIKAPARTAYATAFTMALLHQLTQITSGPILWCGPVRHGGAGAVYANGMAEFGLSPDQFIFVCESHPLRRLSACEEALATPGLAAVVGEYGPLYEKSDLWGKVARRLQLASEKGTATAFLLGQDGAASGFETAWDIAPPRQQLTDQQDWRPVWDVSLTHARGGRKAHASLLWDSTSHHLMTAPTPVMRPAMPASVPPAYVAQGAAPSYQPQLSYGS